MTNIRDNFLEIARIVSLPSFTEEEIGFLLNKCEVVFFVLREQSEAFQFFDSQNARGRDLEPHDLLKAYHLREFSQKDAPLKANTVAAWENSETEDLTVLFAQFLYRIRNWSKAESARYFGKEDVHLFKGLNIDTISQFPYVEPLRMAHHFVDRYNVDLEGEVDGQGIRFPFQLDQAIINGRRFFEMTAHYLEEVSRVAKEARSRNGLLAEGRLNGFAEKIITTIDSYPGRSRTGDRYVRLAFDCLLVYYVDRFGSVEISRAIEKIFVWAYSLRLHLKAIQIASIDNHVLDNNLFKVLKESIRPEDFINYVVRVRETRFEAPAIENLFKEMKYCALPQ